MSQSSVFLWCFLLFYVKLDVFRSISPQTVDPMITTAWIDGSKYGSFEEITGEPSARIGPSGLEISEGVFFLYGGYTSSQQYFGDGWTYSSKDGFSLISGTTSVNSGGTTSSDFGSDNYPSSRMGALLWLRSESVFLWGGQDRNNPRGDLWEMMAVPPYHFRRVLPSQSFAQLSGDPSTIRPGGGRMDSVHYYSDIDVAFLLFGKRYGVCCASPSPQNDVIAYDHTQKIFKIVGSEGSTPPARYGSRSVKLDSTTFVMFGGSNMNDMWKMTLHHRTNFTALSCNWTQLHDGTWSYSSHATYYYWGEAAPGARQHHLMWLHKNNEVFIFGGLSENDRPLNDMWLYSLKENLYMYLGGDRKGTTTTTTTTTTSSSVWGSYTTPFFITQRQDFAYFCSTGVCTIFGGSGTDANGDVGSLADLWTLFSSVGTTTTHYCDGYDVYDENVCAGRGVCASQDKCTCTGTAKESGTVLFTGQFCDDGLRFVWWRNESQITSRSAVQVNDTTVMIFGSTKDKNDVWMINLVTNGGSKDIVRVSENGLAHYGVQGEYHCDQTTGLCSKPPARSGALMMRISSGDVFMFFGKNHGDVWLYDVKENIWKWMHGTQLEKVCLTDKTNQNKDMPIGRSGPFGFHVEDMDRVVMGGPFYDCEYRSTFNMWVYDVKTNSWKLLEIPENSVKDTSPSSSKLRGTWRRGRRTFSILYFTGDSRWSMYDVELDENVETLTITRKSYYSEQRKSVDRSYDMEKDFPINYEKGKYYDPNEFLTPRSVEKRFSYDESRYRTYDSVTTTKFFISSAVSSSIIPYLSLMIGQRTTKTEVYTSKDGKRTTQNEKKELFVALYNYVYDKWKYVGGGPDMTPFKSHRSAVTDRRNFPTELNPPDQNSPQWNNGDVLGWPVKPGKLGWPETEKGKEGYVVYFMDNFGTLWSVGMDSENQTCGGVEWTNVKDVCGGRGICVSQEECECENGWEGPSCDVKEKAEQSSIVLGKDLLWLILVPVFVVVGICLFIFAVVLFVVYLGGIGIVSYNVMEKEEVDGIADTWLKIGPPDDSGCFLPYYCCMSFCMFGLCAVISIPGLLFVLPALLLAGVIGVVVWGLSWVWRTVVVEYLWEKVLNPQGHDCWKDGVEPLMEKLSSAVEERWKNCEGATCNSGRRTTEICKRNFCVDWRTTLCWRGIGRFFRSLMNEIYKEEPIPEPPEPTPQVSANRQNVMGEEENVE